MNRLGEALAQIQSFLREEGIPYMIVGGIANLVWGEARLTYNVDITVSVPHSEFGRLIAKAGERFTVRPKNPQKFLQQTHVLPLQTKEGINIDLIIAGLDYEKEAINRAVEETLSSGTAVRVCTAEDLIIHKIISERERDWEDVKGILLRSGHRLDEGYILSWLQKFAQALDKSDILFRYRALAEQILGKSFPKGADDA